MYGTIIKYPINYQCIYDIYTNCISTICVILLYAITKKEKKILLLKYVCLN